LYGQGGDKGKRNWTSLKGRLNGTNSNIQTNPEIPFNMLDSNFTDVLQRERNKSLRKIDKPRAPTFYGDLMMTAGSSPRTRYLP
jgi:hypothetical protein